MKLLSCTIWILGALVVISTLDALQDPPAVSPSSVVGQALSLRHCSCDAVMWRSDCPGTSYPAPLGVVAADVCKLHRPSNRLVFTGNAGDPSPPVPVVRKLTCQS
jgi:hypothetical protein